jgi:predicted transcriptional regulator
MKALARQGSTSSVGDAMQSDCPTVEDRAMLETAFERMRARGCSAIPVLQEGQLVGLLTVENVGEFMMINTALESATPRAAVDDIFAAR